MFLFTVTNGIVYPTEEALMLSPFKEIWERDKTKRKDVALQEFAYIEFTCSMKESNPFRDYKEDKKEEAVRNGAVKIPGWKPDKLVKQGMEKLIKFQKEASIAYGYYVAAKAGAEKTQNFLHTVDLSEKTNSGGLVYKPDEITKAIKGIIDSIEAIKAIEKAMKEEKFGDYKIRGGREISPFADPASLKWSVGRKEKEKEE